MVRQGISFSNNSNKVYLKDDASVAVTLPEGAQQITLDPSVAQQV